MNVNAAHMNIIMNIITKFARIYTPIVVFAAIALAVIPTLFGGINDAPVLARADIGVALFGLATMWMAVFADVGVTVLAVLNAMRALHEESR